MKPQFYKVGGCVRDKILGLVPKDIDFSVEALSFEHMKRAIVTRCGGDHGNLEHMKIGGPFLKVEKPEFLTIRAIDPVLGGVDFVMARKEGAYSDSRHPDAVEPGTLFDDLARRDFTMNAIAESDSGEFVDPFGGIEDIRNQVIRCVGDAPKRFMEDKLRLLRAVRFHITKGFRLHETVIECLEEMGSSLSGVSVERIREELLKCFEFDTLTTLNVLGQFPSLAESCFINRKLILKPTIRG